MNGGWLDPVARDFTLHVREEDIVELHREDGMVTMHVENLDEGIEIFHDDDRLWRPVKREQC